MSDAVDEVEEKEEEAPKVLIANAPDFFFKTLEELREHLGKQTRRSLFTDSPTTVDFFKSDKNIYSANTTQGSYPFSESGFEKLCKMLKVPSKFVLNLPSDNVTKDLKASLYRMPLKGLNFITKNDVIVGVSEKEQTTSATEVLDNLFPANHAYGIRNIGLSGENLIVSFTRDSITPFIGDTLEYGLSMLHSDHDGSHPQMGHYVWRQVCSNGLIALKLEKISKLSRKMPKDKMFEMFNSRVSENIELLTKSLTGALTRLQETVINPDEKKYLKTFLAKKLDYEAYADLSVKFDDVISHKSESTYYDLMNYVTDSAKNFSVMQRHYVEGLGGQLLANFKPDRASLECFNGYAAHKFAAIQKEND